jgi:glycosyltransferase involved in cell wall biosynthesis
VVKVSVIIPAYNAEPYVGEAIESVLAQTWRDFEVVAIDDGSTDATLTILRSFEPRIRVVSQPNRGPAAARNAGIDNSTGEYIAFLDGDDLWKAEKLSEQVSLLDQRSDVGLVYSESLMFSDAGRRDIHRKIGYAIEPSLGFLLLGNCIPTSTVMFRRDCVNRVGRMSEAKELLEGGEDYEYWLRIAQCYSIAGIPKPLAFYRTHQDNLMGAGDDVDRELRVSLQVLHSAENRSPGLWSEASVDRRLLIARLHIRAGFAWKKKHAWRNCVRRFSEALGYSKQPRVFRWIMAATLLQRWS